jgi:Na+/proline symporter
LLIIPTPKGLYVFNRGPWLVSCRMRLKRAGRTTPADVTCGSKLSALCPMLSALYLASMQHGITPLTILSVVAGYFFLLIFTAWITSRNSNTDDFFINRHKSKWWMVGIGMIGSSISGVTFISIPGVVGAGGLNQAFSYAQVVLGYLVGYMAVALILMPLYYRLKLISIYGYLDRRFGPVAYKTGSAFFILSRLIGSAFRMFLAVMVLHTLLCVPFGIPFPVTVIVAIGLIWVYTFRGGIRTIVFTDTLLTICLLAAIVLTIIAILHALDLNLFSLRGAIQDAGYGKVFFFDRGWSDENNFFKQFLSGALITIVMTGLDQDMMQKNLSCRNIGDAQKNMFLFSMILVVANLLVLTLGALLWMYLHHLQLPEPAHSDQLFPMLAMQHLPVYISLAFIIGLVASAYSSADGVLTALTTAVCVDFLGFTSTTLSDRGDLLKKGGEISSTTLRNQLSSNTIFNFRDRINSDENYKTRIRKRVHIIVSIIFAIVILLFQLINKGSVINELFRAAGFTYGPLLGLFAFGMLTKRKIIDKYAIYVCIAAPVISYFLNAYSKELFGGFTFGFLILAVNGLITFIGLWAISRRDP